MIDRVVFSMILFNTIGNPKVALGFLQYIATALYRNKDPYTRYFHSNILEHPVKDQT